MIYRVSFTLYISRAEPFACKASHASCQKASGFFFIRRARDRGTATDVEKMRLERFWFDEDMTRKHADLEKRAAVFNALIRSDNLKIFLNIWSERNLDPSRALDDIVNINPYRELIPDMPTIIVCMRRLCQLLGLSSSHDTESSFDDRTLLNNKLVLQDLVEDLHKCLPSSSTSTAQNEMTALANNIGSILTAFNGCKLKKTSSRPRDDSGGRIYIHRYAVKLGDQIVQHMFDIVKQPWQNVS